MHQAPSSPSCRRSREFPQYPGAPSLSKPSQNQHARAFLAIFRAFLCGQSRRACQVFRMFHQVFRLKRLSYLHIYTVGTHGTLGTLVASRVRVRVRTRAHDLVFQVFHRQKAEALQCAIRNTDRVPWCSECSGLFLLSALGSHSIITTKGSGLQQS